MTSLPSRSSCRYTRALSQMPRVRSATLPSLRTELLATFAVLALAALIFAVASVVLLYDATDPARGALYICLLIAADVLVVVSFGAYKLRHLVLQPLRAAAATAEQIADGDL